MSLFELFFPQNFKLSVFAHATLISIDRNKWIFRSYFNKRHYLLVLVCGGGSICRRTSEGADRGQKCVRGGLAARKGGVASDSFFSLCAAHVQIRNLNKSIQTAPPQLVELGFYDN